MTTMGRKYWAIAEGFIPGESTGPAPFMTSHETVCILTPVTPMRTWRLPSSFRIAVRLDHTASWCRRNGPSICFSTTSMIPLRYRATLPMRARVSDVPIVCQHTRLDSRQAENALMSTIAYASTE